MDQITFIESNDWNAFYLDGDLVFSTPSFMSNKNALLNALKIEHWHWKYKEDILPFFEGKSLPNLDELFETLNDNNIESYEDPIQTGEVQY